MTQQNARELAKQGDPTVIANVLNRSLQPKGITAIVTRSEGYLHIILESETVPSQKALVPFIDEGMKKLELETIHTINVYGQQTDADVHAWEDEIQLRPYNPIFHPEEQTVLPDDELYQSHSSYEEEQPQVKFGDEGYVIDDMDEDSYDQNLLDHNDMSDDVFTDESFSEDSRSFSDQSFETDEGYDDRLDDEYEGDDDEEGEYDDNEEEEPQEKKKSPLLLIILLVLLVPTAIAAGLHFTGVFPLPFLASSESESMEDASPAPSPSPSPGDASPAPSPSPSPGAASPKPEAETSPAPSPSPAAASPAAVSDPWREAVNKAQNAAILTQSARSQAQWQAVAQEWKTAIDLMKQVPEANPNYATAQQKAVDYQTNLDYATKAAANAPN